MGRGADRPASATSTSSRGPHADRRPRPPSVLRNQGSSRDHGRRRSLRCRCRSRDRARNSRPTRRLRVTSLSHATMPLRRHSIATCRRNPWTTRRHSTASTSGGSAAGTPFVSGRRCRNSSEKVGPFDVRRRVCAMKIAAASAHSSAVSSPVSASNTYAHAAGGGVLVPRHQTGYETSFNGPSQSRSISRHRFRAATGVSSEPAAHVQRSENPNRR